MEGIQLERSEEVREEMEVELSADKTFNLDDCVCDASKNTNNMNVRVFDDMLKFSERRILMPPSKWTVLPVAELVIDDLKFINENSTKKKIGIQLQSGWVVNGSFEGLEVGDCGYHYQQNQGWVWVSLLCPGDSSRSMYLCNLELSNYGMESHCTWCILTESGN